MPDQRVIKMEDADPPPTAACPACDEPGPMLAKLAPAEVYACNDDSCRVREFWSNPRTWGGNGPSDDLAGGVPER